MGKDTENEDGVPRPTTQTTVDRKYNCGEEDQNEVDYAKIMAGQEWLPYKDPSHNVEHMTSGMREDD